MATAGAHPTGGHVCLCSVVSFFWVKVALVEDHKLIARTLADALPSYGVSVGAVVHTALDAVRAVKNDSYDAVVTYIDLGHGPNGTQLAPRLRHTHPRLGIVFLPGLEDPRLLPETTFPLPRGSVYLVKQALHDVGYVARAFDLSVDYATGRKKVSPAESFMLTESQITMLQMVARGLSNRAIARELVMSVQSAKSAVKRLAKKLEVTSNDVTNMRVMLAHKYFQISGKPLGR